ncbi:MAG TPA: V-type ATP synthase subunit D [Candidatus Thermoplasmatota archaeon]|nr:V-type ATP synthase subunit D [Candidatus Thermoplasmatota archaeon]
MAIKDVKPTRSELIELKKKIVLSQKGHKLLKMKRDGLIMEFFKLLDQAKTMRREMAGAHKAALDKIAIAEAVEGSVAVKSASFALLNEPRIEMGRRNLMGVVVPKVTGSSVRARVDQRGYGIIGTSAHIDEAAKAFEGLVESSIKAAEVETSMKRLLEEIEKTKRRVNALEFRVIPDLQETRDFITFRLEEMERENIFRLKKIKAKGEAAEAALEAEPPVPIAR